MSISVNLCGIELIDQNYQTPSCHWRKLFFDENYQTPVIAACKQKENRLKLTSHQQNRGCRCKGGCSLTCHSPRARASTLLNCMENFRWHWMVWWSIAWTEVIASEEWFRLIYMFQGPWGTKQNDPCSFFHQPWYCPPEKNRLCMKSDPWEKYKYEYK